MNKQWFLNKRIPLTQLYHLQYIFRKCISMVINLSNYSSPTYFSSSSLIRAFLLNRFMELIPSSHSLNIEQGKQDLLQGQFSDLHKFSELKPHLNTVTISPRTIKAFGATGKWIRYLVSFPSLEVNANCWRICI